MVSFLYHDDLFCLEIILFEGGEPNQRHAESQTFRLSFGEPVEMCNKYIWLTTDTEMASLRWNIEDALVFWTNRIFDVFRIGEGE